MPIVQQELVCLAAKMVRVLSYYVFQQYIETSQEIRVHIFVDDQARARLLQGLGTKRRRTLEHAVGMTTDVVDVDSFRVWLFRFWGKINLAAISGPASDVSALASEWLPAGDIINVSL